MRRVARSLLLCAAILFGLMTSTYWWVWSHYLRAGPRNVIGVAFEPFRPGRGHLDLAWVGRDSAAEHAGLAAGDQVLAIDREPFASMDSWINRVLRGEPGSTVMLTVANSRGVSDHRVTLPVFRPTPFQAAMMQSLLYYPLFFLTVGLVVLFLRLEDPHAWLLAAVFSGFIGLANWVPAEAEFLVPVNIRRFGLTYHVAARALLPALFYWFFAVFPAPSPLARKVPWLKWALVSMGAIAAATLAIAVARTGSYASVLKITARANGNLGVSLGRAYAIIAFVLGLASLVWNGLRGSAETRRKVRVLMVGTIVGLSPVLMFSAVLFRSDSETSLLYLPFWLWTGGVLALTLVPLSFAYALLKHRVMEIPVLLKRSARYVLVKRGFALSVIAGSVAAAWAVTEFYSGVVEGWNGAGTKAMMPVGIAAAVGGVLALAGARVQRGVQDRMDRAFFRGAYDARQIMEDLAQRIRGVGSCSELAALLEKQISEALHPSSLAIYIDSPDGHLRTEAEGVSAELRTLSRSVPVLAEVSRRGRPIDVPAPDSAAFAPFAGFRPLGPECMVPMAARDGILAGLAVLGQRLSEEPYSSEDKRLLAAVANQAGLAIDSIRLAEKMAERLEKERRAAYELETARLVQTRLLFQHTPLMKTLEYAGRCVQARAVGGDYYDFLDLGENRIALAVADVSGKGLPAALLMASVQATLRTHSACGPWDLGVVAGQLNRLLYESTAPEHFVTLFLGEYEDGSRRLRYANCGHNPPIVLKREGEVRRLEPTGVVLGAFRDWRGLVEETTLEPGDLIAVFTDGITEAVNADGADFGEERLIDTLRNNCRQPLPNALESVIRRVQGFAAGEQADDLTLILAAARI